MLKITLKDVPPFDGQYDLDFNQPFNMREQHWIKKIAGVRILELEDAYAKGDPDLLLAFIVIAVTRAGKLRKEQVAQFVDILMDSVDVPFEIENISDEEEEDDAGPPVTQTQPTSISGGNERISLPGSNGTGEQNQEKSPDPIGAPS